MENNEQLNKVLISYFSQEANAEEEAAVNEWLNANDENRLYFEKMENIWKLTVVKNTVDKIDIEYEWKQFNETIAGRQAKVVPLKVVAAPEHNEAETATGNVRRIPSYKKILAGAVAVVILLFLGFEWGWFAGRTNTTQPTASNDQPKAGSVPSVLYHEANTSGKSKKLLLPDGSEITLAANSEISYEKPFTGTKRDVILKGKAGFKVAKDKTRPFTVLSDDIATTALGTQFTIDNDDDKANITVSLFEGSVVIRSVNAATTKLQQDYILKPGEQLTYSREKVTARISKWKEEKGTQYQPEGEMITGNDSPSLPDNTKGTWYMFNNQPLSEVFEQLKTMYNVEIEYSRKDVAHMYFIGRFDKTDSLDRMLEKIALVNSLKMTKNGKKYVMHK